MKIKSPGIRKAARGQTCTLEIMGACQGGTATTVLAHLPYEDNGLAVKASDMSAAFACQTCHDVIDGRQPWPGDERDYRDWYMRRGQTRTLHKLIEIGIVQVRE